MSDLLTRSTTARFNTNEVTRADIKTRSEVVKNLTEAGIPLETAGAIVGFEALDPNSSNIAPVPEAPPPGRDHPPAARHPLGSVESARCAASAATSCWPRR